MKVILNSTFNYEAYFLLTAALLERPLQCAPLEPFHRVDSFLDASLWVHIIEALTSPPETFEHLSSPMCVRDL